jgi:hypothetical protein
MLNLSDMFLLLVIFAEPFRGFVVAHTLKAGKLSGVLFFFGCSTLSNALEKAECRNGFNLPPIRPVGSNI